MSFFERGPRGDGQSDPSTRQSLRKLQEDPVRLAALLAGANSVVPKRRRRVGFFTTSGVTIVLLLSAIEAPSLFAAVGLTHSHEVSAEQSRPVTRTPGSSPSTSISRTWAPTRGTSNPISTASPQATRTPPRTLARTVRSSGPMARVAASQTAAASATASAKAHGKAGKHGKSGIGKK
ncbi:hypothetical protein Back2_08330 [Nocardioides baekrokdamisoli]|uniref:Uncharacterized protein n=1 Tax=Nocardioides baekrokdamisoli TaxID=1804624 RepID=A0A3G9IDX2_9ACTN|nr:hypothetical protein [Nocardioides baekrokdamisoli]BBH16546.1 hypothetical protein Back2_08330 [Nocardioides baekrokdamisoli]